MKINPVSFGSSNFNTPNSNDSSDNLKPTLRKNSLADMEFNIISDAIRCQNLKNQMNIRIMNLKRNLNSCMAQNLYNKQ